MNRRHAAHSLQPLSTHWDAVVGVSRGASSSSLPDSSLTCADTHRGDGAALIDKRHGDILRIVGPNLRHDAPSRPTFYARHRKLSAAHDESSTHGAAAIHLHGTDTVRSCKILNA